MEISLAINEMKYRTKKIPTAETITIKTANHV